MLYFVADLGSPLVQLIWVNFLVGDHDCEVEELMETLLVFCGNAVLVKRKHKNDYICEVLSTRFNALKTSAFDSSKKAVCSSLVESLRSILS